MGLILSSEPMCGGEGPVSGERRSNGITYRQKNAKGTCAMGVFPGEAEVSKKKETSDLVSNGQKKTDWIVLQAEANPGEDGK